MEDQKAVKVTINDKPVGKISMGNTFRDGYSEVGTAFESVPSVFLWNYINKV